MKARKTLIYRGRSQKKEILLAKLRRGETAANSNLRGQLYKAIRDTAPKRRPEKVQIRSEEMAEIQARCRQHFGEGDFKMTASNIETICVKVGEIQQAIQKSQTGKAVPKNSVPVIVWKTCSEVLSERLSSLANLHYGQGKLWYPSTWADSHLAQAS